MSDENRVLVVGRIDRVLLKNRHSKGVVRSIFDDLARELVLNQIAMDNARTTIASIEKGLLEHQFGLSDSEGVYEILMSGGLINPKSKYVL